MDDMDDLLAPKLEVAVENRGNTRILGLRGELDVATVPSFSQALATAVDGSGTPQVLVDLSNVTFIDSTALMTLLSALRDLQRRGGHMVVACHNPTVLRLFEVTHTNETFEIFPSRERALGHLEAA